MSVYVCLDVGASGGKMSLAQLENGKIKMQELHRFKNAIIKRDHKALWDMEMIFNELLIGLKKVKKLGFDSCTLGIDTWAVDYALIDTNGDLIEGVYSYRDKRTKGFFEKNKDTFNKYDIYWKTGIVPHEFNTMYQLYVHKIWTYNNLHKILLLPDYLAYKLTGEFVAEATNLSTTHFFDFATKNFNPEMLEKVKLDKDKFGRLVFPGESIGQVKANLKEQYDLPDCEVLAVASHDTSAAIAATPLLDSENDVFISSGTWSLLGREISDMIINKKTYKERFTNQLGYENKVTFLKNITGMWILQEIEANLSHKLSIIDLLGEALKNEPFKYIMDCEDKRYLSPDNMMYEIWNYFKITEQNIPYSIGELIRCVIDSLALCYFDNLAMLKDITNQDVKNVYIIGGGSQNRILNQTLANVAKVNVHAGLKEASMLGNIIIQMIAKQELTDLKAARTLITQLLEIQSFKPDQEDYKVVINKYNLIKEMRNK